jgi:hypothetical protein
MTKAQLQHCERVAGIAAGEDWWRLMIDLPWGFPAFYGAQRT